MIEIGSKNLTLPNEVYNNHKNSFKLIFSLWLLDIIATIS